jgi:hypothetical protein
VLAAARAGLLKAANRGLQVLITEIIPSRSPQPVDRGTYRAGWKVEVIDPDRVAIMNPEPHAVFIEFGVRAENVKIGRAMLEALSEWAKRKGLAHTNQEAVGVAWAIAKAMQKKGIFNRNRPGLRILEELVTKRIDNILKEEVAREIQRVTDTTR